MAGFDLIKRMFGDHGERRTAPRSGGPKEACVLVVDDSPTIRAVLGKMLAQNGHVVLKAADGESALEIARRDRPDLIFLDIVMPGMSGFAVLRALRHDPLTCGIPIVMISGNLQATEQFYVQRFGADDFMRKPFDRNEVYLRIGQLVQSGRLAARLPLAPSETPLAMLAAEALSPEELADIPDIAMPDVEATPHLTSTAAMPQATLQVVHGIG